MQTMLSPTTITTYNSMKNLKIKPLYKLLQKQQM